MATSSPNDPEPIGARAGASLVRPLRLLNDEPVDSGSADLLGARTAAVQLASLLRGSHRSTPFTLAVDGGWGMGKSSLMRLVDSELTTPLAPGEEGPEVLTIWYNAWTSSGGDALEGLIKSVLTRFDRNVLRRALRKVSEHRSLARGLRAAAVLLAKPLGISRMIDEWWAAMNADPKARNEMRAALRDIVMEWSGTTGHDVGRRMLVVFVDDLDRCTESTVLAVCEAVKVYLDVPGLAFVIGCDRAAISPGGLLQDLAPTGTAFMEKIFQTSYRVQSSSTRDIRGYVHYCAREAGIDDLLDDARADTLATLAARNPRRIKRVVNGVLLGAKINPTLAHADPEAVIRTVLLQYLYPDFFRLMTAPGQDAVREFGDYVRVWRVLHAQTPPTASQSELLRRFLAEHRLPEQPTARSVQRLALLAELERQLPTEFPGLLADQSFTSLLDDLLAVPGSEDVVRRLREGMDARETEPSPADFTAGSDAQPLLDWMEQERARTRTRVHESTRDDGAGDAYLHDIAAPPSSSLPLPSARGREATTDASATAHGGGQLICCLADSRLNRFVDRTLSRHSYYVVRATRPGEADLAMARHRIPTALLICALALEGEDEVGFTYVAGLRDADRYGGPVIFLTDRITPAREARAEELAGILLSDPRGMLLDMVRSLLGTSHESERAWSRAMALQSRQAAVASYFGPGI